MYLSCGSRVTPPAKAPQTVSVKADPVQPAAVVPTAKVSEAPAASINVASNGVHEGDEDEIPGALVSTTSVPKFISRDEHISMTSTTPASWTDIPPILHYSEEGVKIEFDPAYRNQAEMKGNLWVTER